MLVLAVGIRYFKRHQLPKHSFQIRPTRPAQKSFGKDRQPIERDGEENRDGTVEDAGRQRQEQGAGRAR